VRFCAGVVSDYRTNRLPDEDFPTTWESIPDHQAKTEGQNDQIFLAHCRDGGFLGRVQG